MSRAKTITLFENTVTVTLGEAVSIDGLFGGQHFAAYFPIFVSGVDATHAVDIQVSADDVNWFPAKDLSDVELTNITSASYFIMSGKVRRIRVVALTMTDTSQAVLVTALSGA